MGNITKGNFGNGQRRLEARKKRKKIFITLLCITVFVIALFLSPLFNIRSIEVVGTEKLTPDYVTEKAGLTTGIHITRVDLKEVESRLSKTPCISSPRVSYVFPNSLKITITEKMPVVYYGFADGYVGINADGVVTDIVQDRTITLPVAEGITLTSYAIGERPSTGATPTARIDVLTEVAGAIYKAELSGQISSINVNEITNIILTSADGSTVKLGTTDKLEYKLNVLKGIFGNSEYNHDKGVIDLSSPETGFPFAVE